MQYLGMRIPGRKKKLYTTLIFFDMNGHRLPCSLSGMSVNLEFSARHGHYSTISVMQNASYSISRMLK